MRINIKLLIYITLFFIPYIHFYGYDAFPTWRIFNILFVMLCFFYFKKINKNDIPIDFVFLIILFLISILAQFVYLILDKRFGAYEPFYFISVVFLFSFSLFLFVLLKTDRENTLKVLLLSILFMVVYQIFQFSAYALGFKNLTTILNQIDIDKITVFYKIVGTVMGAPSFLSESGMLALYLGPVLGILLIYEKEKIFKPNKFIYLAILTGMILTLSGGAFLEFVFIGILIFLINLSKIALKQYIFILIIICALGWLIQNNPGYYTLITERINSLFSGKSGRLEGARIIIDIFFDNNIYFGIAPKSGRFFEADQNMLLPMLLTDHGLIGTFCISLILLLPYFTALVHPKNYLLLIPYTGFLIHLFLAYGTFMWSYLWIIYVLVLFGLTIKSDTKI